MKIVLLLSSETYIYNMMITKKISSFTSKIWCNIIQISVKRLKAIKIYYIY